MFFRKARTPPQRFPTVVAREVVGYWAEFLQPSEVSRTCHVGLTVLRGTGTPQFFLKEMKRSTTALPHSGGK